MYFIRSLYCTVNIRNKITRENLLMNTFCNSIYTKHNSRKCKDWGE